MFAAKFTGLLSSNAAVITSVVETGGDNEPTDTITAKWTGQTFPVSIANEPLPGLVVGNNYTVGTFGVRAPALVDRAHVYTNHTAGGASVLSYLDGAEYIMSGNDNRDNASYKLDVTIGVAARAYMLVDNRLSDGDNATPPSFGPTSMQWMLDQGWVASANGLNRTLNAAVPDEVGFDESANGNIDQWFSVYYKDFSAGTFSLFQADNAGRNMYGVVVAVVPEPATVGLLSLGGVAAWLFRRRKQS